MSDTKDLVAPLLASLLTPAIAGAGVWLQGHLSNRDDRFRAKLAREETVEMIELLEKWMKIQELACSPEEFNEVKRTARQRLDDLYQALDKVQKSKPKNSEAQRSLMERIFLLHRPAGLSGWMAAIIFYGLILVAGLIAVVNYSDYRNSQLGDYVTGYIVLYVACAILILPVHAWAANADAKTRQQSQVKPLPIPT